MTCQRHIHKWRSEDFERKNRTTNVKHITMETPTPSSASEDHKRIHNTPTSAKLGHADHLPPTLIVERIQGVGGCKPPRAPVFVFYLCSFAIPLMMRYSSDTPSKESSPHPHKSLRPPRHEIMEEKTCREREITDLNDLVESTSKSSSSSRPTTMIVRIMNGWDEGRPGRGLHRRTRSIHSFELIQRSSPNPLLSRRTGDAKGVEN